MKSLFHLIIFIVLLADSTGSIAESTTSKQYTACMEKSGGVTIAMMDCIAEETRRQDSLLNSAYKSLMGALSAQRKRDLQEAQRAWLRYRDLNCKFYANPEGGTADALTANECFMTITAVRVRELESMR